MDFAWIVLVGSFVLCVGGLLVMDWFETRQTRKTIRKTLNKYWN